MQAEDQLVNQSIDSTTLTYPLELKDMMFMDLRIHAPAQRLLGFSYQRKSDSTDFIQVNPERNYGSMTLTNLHSIWWQHQLQAHALVGSVMLVQVTDYTEGKPFEKRVRYKRH